MKSARVLVIFAVLLIRFTDKNKSPDYGGHFVKKLSSIVFYKEKTLSSVESVIVGYIL